jgi:hypothetical protein
MEIGTKCPKEAMFFFFFTKDVLALAGLLEKDRLPIKLWGIHPP